MKIDQGAQKSGVGNGKTGATIHWPATLARKRDQALDSRHLCYRKRQSEGAPLHCLVLDCSASMLAHRNLSLAKGVMQDYVRYLYQQRAKVCVIGFGHGGVRVLLSPQRVAQLNDDWIAPISGSGGSPAAGAVSKADHLLAEYRKRFPEAVTTLSFLSDGRFNLLPDLPQQADTLHVIDFEQGAVHLQRARLLAKNWNAQYSHINEILPQQIQQPTPHNQ